MTAGERALLLAAFSTALGLGMLLPLLPLYVSSTGDAATWHLGAAPVVFLAAAAGSAPLWGRLSDRVPRIRVLACGLAASAAAVLPFAIQHSVATLYAYQVIAGIAFGAVGPAALAMLYEARPPGTQALGVSWFGAATLAGYLAGPAAAGWIATLAADAQPHRPVLLALALQSALAVVALVLVAAAPAPRAAARASEVQSSHAGGTVAGALLVAFVIGGFEILASLYVQSPLHLGAREAAMIFSACSGAMLLAQLFVLPRLPAHVSRVRLAMRCMMASAVLLAAMGFVQPHGLLVAVALLQGAALGLAVGLLSFEAAASAGARRGSVLGWQNAALNAGQALGSATGAAAFVTLGAAAFPAFAAAILLATALPRRR